MRMARRPTSAGPPLRRASCVKGLAPLVLKRTADGPRRPPEGELQVDRLLAELHQSEGGRFNDRRTADPPAASSKPEEESIEDEAPKMERWQPEVMGQMVTAHNEIMVRAALPPCLGFEDRVASTRDCKQHPPCRRS